MHTGLNPLLSDQESGGGGGVGGGGGGGGGQNRSDRERKVGVAWV